MKYDEIVAYLGEFGPYQRRLFVLVSLPMSCVGLQIMLTLFTLGVPEHRCAVPNWDNDTYTIQNDLHANVVNTSIPRLVEGSLLFSSCDVYDFSNDTLYGTKYCTNTTRMCSRWVYSDEPFGSTVVTQYDWVCERTLWKSHAQMMLMLGSLLGCMLSGPPSDLIGRKKIYMLGIVLYSVSAISVAFAKSFPVFALLYFFIGISCPAIFGNGFVIVVELVGPSKRVWAGIFIEFFWVFGCVIAVTGGYFVTDWQHLQLIVSVPSVIFLGYYWIMPESARWLISKERYKEADRILRHAAKVNGKTLPRELFRGEILRKENQEPFWKIFTSPTLVVRSLIIFLNWAVCSLGFYGLSLNLGSLAGNIFVNIYIGLAVETLAYVACLLLLDRIGRKALHCTAIIMGGLCCTATIISVLVKGQNLVWLSTALALTGRGFVSVSFATIWLYASELFPTVIRNTAMSVSNLCARSGAAISPYIAHIALLVPGDFGRSLPLIIFGSSMLLAGFLALLLPETLHRDLPETFRDAKRITRTKRNNPDDINACNDQEEFVHLNSGSETTNNVHCITSTKRLCPQCSV